jgi:NAD-dependent deacetylase
MQDESGWNTWVTGSAWNTGTMGDAIEIRTAIGDMAEFLEDAHRLVVLTGAGVSTESGIPDFRGPNGAWARRPAPTYRAFMQDPAARREYWRTRRELAGLVTQARPNAAHYALVEMERRGMLAGIITQNFDGLHQEAGSPQGSVIELHGTSREAACQSCGARLVMAEVQARVDAGDEEPRCNCGGFLKAATILFGQPVHRPVLDAALALTRTCDLFLVVGSSLRVVPAARLPLLALERGVPLLIINLEPTPLDSRADSVLHAPAGHVLPRLLALLPTSA